MADPERSSASLGDISAEARLWFDQHWDPSLSLRQWWSMLADSGWGFPQWPTGRFGRSLSGEAAAAVQEKRHEAGAVGPPKDGGTMLAAPTLLKHGNEAQLDRYLPGIAAGTERWCQLFSEPGAGSDLAALRTSALRDGDTWVINGQKVWTSGAQEAHYGLLLARTNPAVPKHRGISYFVIDMNQPGVEVRPLREMTGRAAFNEVFLTDATVSNDDLVGEPNEGWRVANTTLSVERGGLATTGGRGGGRFDIRDRPLDTPIADLLQQNDEEDEAAELPRGWRLLAHAAGELERDNEPLIRSLMATEAVFGEISRRSGERIQALTEQSRMRGETPTLTPLAAVQKLAASQNLHRFGRALLETEGPAGMLAPPDALFEDRAMETIASGYTLSIGGGSDQIQRNIIGERVLGLPSEPRLDKALPFNQLPN